MSEYQKLPNLASARLGAHVIAANDDFFAPKENLLKDSKPIFIDGKYTGRGKWMDGWETRRRRTPGHDWCIVRLGLPGLIRAVIVDTSFFRGNFPEQCSLEACAIPIETGAKRELAALDAPSCKWYELLPQSDLKGDSENIFEIKGGHRFTHVRLKIYPDGGVARLRIHGEVVPTSPISAKSSRDFDLAAIQNGGRIIAASDDFYSAPLNLLMPGRSKGMHDGWETRRRRGSGNDWAIIKLGAPGAIRRIEVDTAHFKGNFPDSCSVDAIHIPDGSDPGANAIWRTLLPQSKLRANALHAFRKEIASTEPASHIRFNIYPDGGVSRLRIWGAPAPESQGIGFAWFNSLPEKKAAAALLDCCGSREWVRRMLARRPFADQVEFSSSADEIWNGLARKDWLQAFRHHPRIGAKKADRRQSAKGGKWSAKEQSTAAQASSATRAAMAAANRAVRSRLRPYLHHVRQRKIGRRDPQRTAAAPRQQQRNRIARRRRRAAKNHTAAPGEIASIMTFPITTHVLDTSLGRPAQGVAVILQVQVSGAEWKEIARGVTGLDGRLTDLIAPGKLAVGNYRLRFQTGAYFSARQAVSLYPYIEITIEVSDAAQHYHVPLLVSPYGYTTYRGS